MKKLMFVLIIVCCFLVACLYANVNQNYQQAIVVNVDKYEAPSVFGGGNPSDSPLQPEVYAHDIGLKMNCDLYVGRYQSAIDYLPSAFARDHIVDVRLQNHVLYVSLPNRDRELEMGVISHSRLNGVNCASH